MPQIPYKRNETLTFTPTNPVSKVAVTIPSGDNYTGFSIQNVNVTDGLNVEVSLDGTTWSLLYSIYLPAAVPHIPNNTVVSFELETYCPGGVRLVCKENLALAGKAIISMYNRAYPNG